MLWLAALAPTHWSCKTRAELELDCSSALESGAETNSIWDQQQQLGLGRMDTATAHISQRDPASAKPAQLVTEPTLWMRWDRKTIPRVDWRSGRTGNRKIAFGFQAL